MDSEQLLRIVLPRPGIPIYFPKRVIALQIASLNRQTEAG